MKSLQVLIPHKECIFRCPFCISRTHTHRNEFLDQYHLDHEFWKQQFLRCLKEYQDLQTVVITGTSEPLLDMPAVNEMIDLVREHRKDVQIEIQTRYYLPVSFFSPPDVIAFSIAQKEYLKKPTLISGTNRYVILLTDSFKEFSLEEMVEMIPKGVSQLTFKKLHDSHGLDLEIDRWIEEHQLPEEDEERLELEVSQYRGPMSIRLDKNCMDASDRYMVFREDGHLYLDWKAEQFIF